VERILRRKLYLLVEGKKISLEPKKRVVSENAIVVEGGRNGIGMGMAGIEGMP
jgi:hypothetical protein